MDESEKMRRLHRENHELRRANEIVRKASALFRSGTREAHDEMIRFIDMRRDQFGIEAIGSTLGVRERGFTTSGGYRAATTRTTSARALPYHTPSEVETAYNHQRDATPVASQPRNETQNASL